MPSRGGFWKCQNCGKRRQIIRGDLVKRIITLGVCTTSSNTRVSGAANAGLSVYRSAVFPGLLDELKDNPDNAVEIGQALGILDRDPALKSLLETIPTSRRRVQIVCTLVGLALLAAGFADINWIGILWPFWAIGAILYLTVCWREESKGASMALRGLGDIRAIAPLGRAVLAGVVSGEGVNTLIALLGVVDARHSATLSPGDLSVIENLCGFSPYWSYGINIAAIEALSKVGSHRSLARLRKLTRRRKNRWGFLGHFDVHIGGGDVISLPTGYRPDISKQVDRGIESLENRLRDRRETNRFLRAPTDLDIDNLQLLRPGSESENRPEEF